MSDPNIPSTPGKFILNLVISIRHVAIYPLKHPIVTNSIKNLIANLAELLATRETLNIGLSPDNKIMANGESIADRNVGDLNDFVTYFKKINVEDLQFATGITPEEVTEFIKLFQLDPAEIKKAQDINLLFKEHGITHIKAKQFSYIKVEKGQETLVAAADISQVEALKAKVKDYCDKKVAVPEDIRAIEMEMFNAIGAEFKEKKKLGASLKNLFKKFVMQVPEQGEETISRLKQALIDYGCPPEEVDALISKIREEIARGPVKRPRGGGGAGGGVSDEEFENLRKAHQELQSKFERMQQDLQVKSAEVAQLEKQNKRVHDEKQRIDNIIHHMAEGMVVVDSDGKILLVNPTAESLLGITKADIGKQLKDVVKDEHLLTLTKQIAPTQEAVVEKEVEFLSADESTKKVVRTSSAVVEDHNGNTVGMVTMLNDITHQKEVEKIKTDFLSTVSHELRTPLVAVEKSISLILGKSAGEISPNQEQFLSIAERNLKRLSLLINDLLDLSKLEARKMELRKEAVGIEQVIGDTIDGLTNWAQTKNITLEKRCQPALPPVLIDPNRMAQVLTNLLGNAIKFTPPQGRITVEAALSTEGQGMRVTVSDTGPGIAQEDLTRVFEKFYQTKERTVTDITGTGIGLAIVKEIVELHGGTVWVESEKGRGARFIFTVPITAT
ncbi:MAG TPA: ATP-binding protein [Candidatus Omnitrophota bacterium]|nr:ATP-binding protein [Candidatus Omnitrophota bacterium]HRZ14529.1 ATP-binding protein [Candidatus Omnitrophota bacterium]